jgi:hypothetical protein
VKKAYVEQHIEVQRYAVLEAERDNAYRERALGMLGRKRGSDPLFEIRVREVRRIDDVCRQCSQRRQLLTFHGDRLAQ